MDLDRGQSLAIFNFFCLESQYDTCYVIQNYYFQLYNCTKNCFIIIIYVLKLHKFN